MDFTALEAKVDDLIALCEALAKENKELREQQALWQAQRAKLIERNELAKAKIDAMIGRLRSLDETQFLTPSAPPTAARADP
jgi:cell division protein ZapB